MNMKTIISILLAAITIHAAPTAPDVRIIENNGQYGPTPGIWGNYVPPDHTGKFPVNDLFFVRTELRANVSPVIRSEFAWQNVGGQDLQRIMSIGVNAVNIGNAPLEYGNAFNSPQNYFSWGESVPGISNLLTVTLRDTNNVQVVHTFRVHGILTWWNRPAIPSPPSAVYGPWNQGLRPGYASQGGLEPDGHKLVIDTSEVEDGEYYMTLQWLGGNATTRRVKFDAMELTVTGF